MEEKYVSTTQPKRAGPGKSQNARPTIGLLIEHVAGPGSYQAAVWTGATEASRAQDANLICLTGGTLGFSPFDEFVQQRNSIYELATRENVDGLVISSTIGSYTDQGEFRKFCDRYCLLPRVSIGTVVPGIPSVLVDNTEGMHEAITHLVEAHGYRRIAFIRGPEGNEEAKQRYQVYTEVLAEYNLPLDPDLVAPGDFSPPAGTAAVRLFLDERKVDLQAIVAANDMMALAAMEELQVRGIRVPSDVAVVGFDDMEEAMTATPSLTTVQQPTQKLGQRAVEVLLALLADKQVPEQTMLPTELVVRQSCGCQDPCVKLAGQKPDHAASSQKQAARQPIQIASEMIQAAHASALEGIYHQVTDLIEEFRSEVNGGESGAFLNTFDRVLQRAAKSTDEISIWHNAISVLRRQVLPEVAHDAESAARFESLVQQAQVMIGRIAERTQAARRFQATQQENHLRAVGHSLITTLDVDELMNVLAEELPGLGIPSCYLSLFENPKFYQYPSPAPEWTRLVLACGPEGRTHLEQGGRRFPSRRLIPDELWPQDRACSFVLLPLHFQQEQLGFALFESGSRNGMIYESLRAQISSALQGAMLVKRGGRRSTQLQTAAEVSHAASSILDLDELLSQTVELIRDHFDLYYTGLFLVDQRGEWADEPAKWAVLRAGTGEAGQKMLEAGHRLEVGGSSMVGWCIANRKARIALDVGKEAVRFSNPLLPHTRSELALPLVSRGQVIGAMTVQSDRPAAFTQEDIISLQSMADQLANAIENARLFTEHRQAEEVLAQERNLLRALIDNIPDRIYAKDTESRFIVCNLASARRMGKTSPDELIGKSDFDFVPRELAEQFYADEQAIIRSGQSLLNREEPLETVDGKVTRWNLATKVPLRDSQGNIIGIVGMGREITELKQTQLKLERNAIQLRTAAEISRAASSLLTLDELLPQVVELIRDRFDLYYVGLFLVDESGQHAVLQAGTGEAGQKMLETHHQVELSSTSMVGWCIAHQQARIALDVGQDAAHLANRLLPETRSEMALPLISRGQAIGALTIQSSQETAFTEDDTIILQTMAGQIANAIENARLFERAQTALKEMEATQRRYVQKVWEEYLSSTTTTHYETGRPGSTPLGDTVLPEMRQAVEQQTTVVSSSSGDTDEAVHLALVTPIALRGAVIGVLGVHDDQETRQWTAEEIALVEAVTERMAQTAENLQLFDEAQRRVAREQLIGEVTARIRGSATVEGILNAAVREISQATGASFAAIDLELPEAS